MTVNASWATLLVLSGLVLSGCQTLAPTQNKADFNALYEAGDYRAAADAAVAASTQGMFGQRATPKLLWSLQAGAALTASGDFATSNSVLDAAEELAKSEDTESLGRKGMEMLTTTLVNNNLNRYSPSVYDGVMINTYKALNNIFLQDHANARIEFNRAADRQRRAEDYFSARIEAEQQKKTPEQKEIDPAASPLNMVKSQEEAEKSIYESYPELQNWEVYPNFVNPYTDYLHGLFFLLASDDRDDYGKARDSLRRVAGMNPNNPAVKTDLMVVNKLIRGQWKKQNLNPAVWVIFENGLGPEIEELLVPIPLYMVSDKVEYSQIALPKLITRNQAYTRLDLYSGKRKLGSTAPLADFDRVVQTEFQAEFPYRVTEAVMSTLAKGLIQYKAREQAGLAGALVAGVYQATTTRADTRIWSALPKEIQVARLRPPADRKLLVTAPGMSTPLSIELPDSQFTIVYIKATTTGTAPVFQVAGY